jgi:hypothetical protein
VRSIAIVGLCYRVRRRRGCYDWAKRLLEPWDLVVSDVRSFVYEKLSEMRPKRDGLDRVHGDAKLVWTRHSHLPRALARRPII